MEGEEGVFGVGARFNVFNVATLVEHVRLTRLTRLTRLNRRRESCTDVSCPQPSGNGCRLVPELDATDRRVGHGGPRAAPAHRVPEVQS